MVKNVNNLDMLNQGLEETAQKPKEEKIDIPNSISDDLLSFCTNAYYDCKWYDFFSRKAWKKIMKAEGVITQGLSTRLSNLVIEISQSETKYVTPLTETDLMRVDVKDNLAAYLIKREIIKFTITKGEDHGKETITVTAKINVKP